MISFATKSSFLNLTGGHICSVSIGVYIGKERAQREHYRTITQANSMDTAIFNGCLPATTPCNDDLFWTMRW